MHHKFSIKFMAHYKFHEYLYNRDYRERIHSEMFKSRRGKLRGNKKKKNSHYHVAFVIERPLRNLQNVSFREETCFHRA